LSPFSSSFSYAAQRRRRRRRRQHSLLLCNFLCCTKKKKKKAMPSPSSSSSFLATQRRRSKCRLWSCAATLRILCSVAPQTNKQNKHKEKRCLPGSRMGPAWVRHTRVSMRVRMLVSEASLDFRETQFHHTRILSRVPKLHFQG